MPKQNKIMGVIKNTHSGSPNYKTAYYYPVVKQASAIACRFYTPQTLRQMAKFRKFKQGNYPLRTPKGQFNGFMKAMGGRIYHCEITLE